METSYIKNISFKNSKENIFVNYAKLISKSVSSSFLRKVRNLSLTNKMYFVMFLIFNLILL